MNVILDMDNTLIGHLFPAGKEDDEDAMIPVERPYLKEFLNFCFDVFNTVSIWTAGNKEWFDEVYKTVLKPNLPEEKDFDYVFTRKDCTKESEDVFVKDLRILFESGKYPHTDENTIIIDDVSDSYKYTPLNGIYIKPYDVDNTHDNELNEILPILSDLVVAHAWKNM